MEDFFYSVYSLNFRRNAGHRATGDQGALMNYFVCVCRSSYSENFCDVNDARMKISFVDSFIPRSLMIILVRVEEKNVRRKFLSTNIRLVSTRRVYLFNFILARIEMNFYLISLLRRLKLSY